VGQLTLDLEPLNLWKPILEFANDEECKIRKYCFWVLGTSIQNNPSSQLSVTRYLRFDLVC
jgi:hypothetical protein